MSQLIRLKNTPESRSSDHDNLFSEERASAKQLALFLASELLSDTGFSCFTATQ